MHPHLHAHIVHGNLACTCCSRYALVLVQREVAKNDLMLVAFDIEGQDASTEVAAGDRKMSDLRNQVWDAEHDLTKAQTEGPANHRKRDFLDKVRCPDDSCLLHPMLCWL